MSNREKIKEEFLKYTDKQSETVKSYTNYSLLGDCNFGCDPGFSVCYRFVSVLN